MRRLLIFMVVACFCVFSMTEAFSSPVKKGDSPVIELAFSGEVVSPLVMDDVDPPVVGAVELVTSIPGKGTGTEDWLFWIFGAIAVVLYEIVFRVFPTTRDWSILSLLYKVCNLLAPNRVKGGGIFKVKKTK